MTRTHLKRRLRWIYAALFLVLAAAFVSKLADYIPGLSGTAAADVANDIYDYLKDMTLVFVTVIAAYLAHLFQRRSNFVNSLEEEWRNIVKTKSRLCTYCEMPFPSTEDYLKAYSHISETIDNMRIIYKNVGETDDLVGLYPYAPLHDMRRVLTELDPRTNGEIPQQKKDLVRDCVLRSFSALRENFLEELDLTVPAYPLLISGGRRLKSPGANRHARARQNRQLKRHRGSNATATEADQLLQTLYESEKERDHAKANDSA
jgi:hypothetical protein